MQSIAEIIKDVANLELVAKKNAFSLLTGDYVTSIPGRGMDFHEARKYVTGEPIRLIDWNMTARLGEPYVKVFLDERQRDVFIALDVSPSMFSGWQDKTKTEYAIEIAATLAVSVIQSRDRLGHIIFTDKPLEVARPMSGKKQLFRTLKSFLSYGKKIQKSNDTSDIRAAIHSIQKFKGNRFVVFIISDFIDQDIPEDLKYIKSKHDLNLIHIYDKVEYAFTSDVRFPAYSPEGAKNSSIIHPGQTGSLQTIQKYLLEESLKYNISLASVSTTDSVSQALRNLFFLKKRRKV
ncbi:MAG: DUF58 domain-containing protein [Leptospiraceae bacterium]|nr:DUF58 domain-containing protein [Leptospiraceae bacterium]MCP5496003.1 DUF58 domain-containing protein [Leptospiraceae bacterium]